MVIDKFPMLIYIFPFTHSHCLPFQPALMIPLNDRKISRISAGGDFTMAADEDGAIFVWGKKSITQNFASTTSSSSSSSSSATKVLSSSTSPSKMCKPFVRCGDRTVGRRMKEKVKELRLGSAKRVVERFVDDGNTPSMRFTDRCFFDIVWEHSLVFSVVPSSRRPVVPSSRRPPTYHPFPHASMIL